MQALQIERHRSARVGWLRASVLGANDGILSTASLVLGVAAAHANHGSVMVAGVAGLVAGAMSMAAGEYVSVHSQADTEKADLKLERAELKSDDAGEHKELAAIYVARGLDRKLAKQVADQLMAHDALGAHARDELGISPAFSARPIQAAFGLGRQLRRRSGDASRGHRHGSGLGSDTAGRRDFARVSGASRRVGRARWGRRRFAGRHTRHLLGCSGHGGNGGCRSIVRDRRGSLILLNYDEGNVVVLRRPLSEFSDGLQESLLDRLAPRGRLLPDHLQKPLPSEHFLLRVLRVCNTI